MPPPIAVDLPVVRLVQVGVIKKAPEVGAHTATADAATATASAATATAGGRRGGDVAEPAEVSGAV